MLNGPGGIGDSGAMPVWMEFVLFGIGAIIPGIPNAFDGPAMLLTGYCWRDPPGFWIGPSTPIIELLFGSVPPT